MPAQPPETRNDASPTELARKVRKFHTLRVLTIKRDLCPTGFYKGTEGGQTTSIVAPGQVHFIRHPDHSNQIIGSKIVMAKDGREAIAPQTAALIMDKVKELRDLIAQTMGDVTPRQLDIHLGTMTRTKQTIVSAIWDIEDGIDEGCD